MGTEASLGRAGHGLPLPDLAPPPAQAPLNSSVHMEMSLQSPKLTHCQLRLNITAEMLPALHIQVCNANQQKRFKAGSKQEQPKIEQLQNCTGEKPYRNHHKNNTQRISNRKLRFRVFISHLRE